MSQESPETDTGGMYRYVYVYVDKLSTEGYVIKQGELYGYQNYDR